jgi:outer membrane protein TolC
MAFHGDSMKNRLVSITLLSACASLAQTNQFMTWEQCLEKTKAHNPDLVSARAAVRELEFGVASASSGFLPQLDVSAGFTKSGAENDAGWKENDRTTAGLDLSQDLFSGGGNLAKRKRALAQLEIGNEQYRKTLSDVELRVRQAYVEVLYAQNLIDLTERITQRRSDNVRLIQLRFDGGRENAGSLARSKAQLSQAEFEEREARRSLTYALRNLAAAMGQMAPAVGASGDLNAQVPEDLIYLEDMMKQTPDYEIAKTQIEAARQGMLVSRSDRFPSVSLNASVGLSGDRDLEFGDWSVGARASMPLFTGGRNRANVAAEKEKIIQSEMDLLDTGNSLMSTLQQRWNAYIDAVENEVVQKQLFDAEMLRAEISTAKYKQGLLDYEDWDIIESNLINQGKTHLQRRRTAELEQARWKNALGWSVWQVTEEGE